jgi:signal peptidase I
LITWRPAVEAGPEPDAGDLPPFATGERPPRRTVKELPLLVALAVVIAFLFKTLVAQAFYIPSGSMEPQLDIGDRVVVSKLAYRLHHPRRGDIVVFDCPPRAPQGCPTGDHGALPARAVRGLLEAIGLRQPSTEEYIKRVIGLPGDTVEGRSGVVFVDGRQLREPYLPTGTVTSDFPRTTVGPGQLWVMGDNRGNSSDSRVFGVIQRSKVVGRAIVRVWPPGRLAFL